MPISQPGNHEAEKKPTCMPPVLTQHIIKLAEYQPETNQAGDIYFPSTPVMFNRIFTPFGFVIPADTSNTGQDKANPQPTFIAPLKTKVYSPLDGTVVNIVTTLWSTPSLGDVSIHILPDGLAESCYVVVELEHVVNPAVQEGDRVKAGQEIAEVGPLNAKAQAGLGTVELGVLSATREGNPVHTCPFFFFSPEVREQRLNELSQMLADWEAFVNDPSLYDETAWVNGTPGCLAREIHD
ncbi:MAG: M23 family metallopeptidase [Anaerolineae bacterium]